MAVTTDREVVRVLHDLEQTIRDREQGYVTARGGVKDPALKQLFEDYAQQSQQFTRELQQAIRGHGSKSDDGGSVAGVAFRGWMHIKAAVTGGDEAAILSECERGEDVAVRNYRHAFQQELPAELKDLVARQFNEIEAAHDHIRTLRDAAKG